MKTGLHNLLVLLLPVITHAQLPETDIWLFKVFTEPRTGKTLLEAARNITAKPGYENQPCFSVNEKALWYVAADGTQTDIYSYDIRKKEHIRLTRSEESEYSPKPAHDGNLLSTVVVEKDSTLKIYLLNPETGTTVKKLKPDSCGYYTYLNNDTIVYYKLTSPHSLWHHVIKTGKEALVANSPSRSFFPLGRSKLLFGVKDTSMLRIFIYDFILHKATLYANYPSPEGDMFWNQTHGLIVSDGSKLMKYIPSNASWLMLYDLSSHGIKKISRFAFDSRNKHLAVVSVN